MTLRAWTRFTTVASVAGLTAFAVVIVGAPPDGRLAGFFNVWVYNGLMVLATLIAGSRAVLVRRDRAAWIAFTVALGSWTFAEIWAAVDEPATYPSVADLGFIGFYPLAYVGMVLLLRSRVRAIGGTLWLDGVIASLAAAALAAAVLVELVLESTEGSTSVVATNVAYPLGDVLLLSAVFGVFSLARWRPGRQWLLLGLGICSTALADAIYLFQSAEGTYVEGTWIDILWPASMLLVAAAAWVPDRRDAELDVQGRPLVAVPAVCALVAIGVLVYDHFERTNPLALVLASATLVAVVVRLAVTFQENGRLFELTKHESVTDALTGLGNRRKLLADLDSRLEREEAEPTLLMIFDLDGFKGYNDTFGHPAGDALLTRLGAKLHDVTGSSGAAYRLGGDEFCLVAAVEASDVEPLIDRACAALQERGEGFDVGSSFGAVMLPEEAADSSLALHLADERLYAQKRSRRTEADRTIQSLLDALSLREPGAQSTLADLGALAVETGRMLGLRLGELEDLERTAELHDLGKLAVPDEILSKPGPLDEREWDFIRQHTIVGERILRASPALRDVATIVRSTHERWDGDGYPDGLAGESIPLAARIVFACEAFTSMTTVLPYRDARSPEDALAELERCAGTQFDPTVVRVLSGLVRDRLEAQHPA
jgi:diguanylate cyclase (GGDEF)-like protein